MISKEVDHPIPWVFEVLSLENVDFDVQPDCAKSNVPIRLERCSITRHPCICMAILQRHDKSEAHLLNNVGTTQGRIANPQ